MTRPRNTLISVESTPYYHLVSRCVRRAFLCGIDRDSGRDFEHRRTWVVEKLAELDAVFAIGICSYAVMSNHYHLVVRIDRDEAVGWNDSEVVERWLSLFSGPVLIQRFRGGANLSQAELDEVNDIIAEWRERLCSISWFMRILNESLARKANEEDDCKGRFWEGRFKSQALLDEAAVISAMAYVDLNPIRARLAETPETSEHTAIKQRIETQQKRPKPDSQPTLHDLSAHIHHSHDHMAKPPLPIGFSDYLELVDWTGRAIRDDKRGYIPNQIPPILQRLAIDPDYFVAYCQGKSKVRCTAIGCLQRIKEHAQHIGQRWVQGLNLAPS